MVLTTRHTVKCRLQACNCLLQITSVWLIFCCRQGSTSVSAASSNIASRRASIDSLNIISPETSSPHLPRRQLGPKFSSGLVPTKSAEASRWVAKIQGTWEIPFCYRSILCITCVRANQSSMTPAFLYMCVLCSFLCRVVSLNHSRVSTAL